MRLMPTNSHTRDELPRTGRVAARLVALASTPSTNALADQLIREGSLPIAPGGVSVVAADTQTAGRGRLDHTWMSRADESFTVSFIVAVPRSLALDTSLNGWLQMIAGLAALDGLNGALEECNARPMHDECGPRLKWPNDILLHGRKLGGILTQLVALPHDEDHVAIIHGIGLNLAVGREHLPTPQSTSLQLHYRDLPDVATLRDAIAARLVVALARRLAAFTRDPQSQARLVRDETRSLCFTLGRHAVAHFTDGTELEGEAIDLRGDAALVLRDGDGVTHVVRTADVGVLPDPCV